MDRNWLLCFVCFNFVSIQAFSNDNAVDLRRFIKYLNRYDRLDAQKDTLIKENYEKVPSNDNFNGKTYYDTSLNLLPAEVKTDIVNHKSANKRLERGNGRYSVLRNGNRYRPRKSIQISYRDNRGSGKSLPLRALLVSSNETNAEKLSINDDIKPLRSLPAYILHLKQSIDYDNHPSNSVKDTKHTALHPGAIQSLVHPITAYDQAPIKTLQGILRPVNTVSQPSDDDDSETAKKMQNTSNEDNPQSDEGPQINQPSYDAEASQSVNSAPADNPTDGEDAFQSGNSVPADPPSDNEDASQFLNDAPTDQPNDDGQFIPGKSLLQQSNENLNSEDSAVKFPKKKILTHLVYGNPDNLSITYGKIPYRLQNTGFRKTNNLVDMFGTNLLNSNLGLSTSSQSKSPKKWVIIVIPPMKKKPNPLLKMIKQTKDQDEENDASEILDGFHVDDGQYANYRRKVSKSNFRDRQLSDETSSSSESSSSSSGSSSEENPGNPFTLHKGKYRQNWMWNHNMDGDHMNLNPYGPLLSDLSATGKSLFFGRKWWYFNQDDYKPMG